MAAKVNEETCTGCEACIGCCPTEAIVMEADKAKVTDDCIDCGACVDECPVEAITMEQFLLDFLSVGNFSVAFFCLYSATEDTENTEEQII